MSTSLRAVCPLHCPLPRVTCQLVQVRRSGTLLSSLCRDDLDVISNDQKRRGVKWACDSLGKLDSIVRLRRYSNAVIICEYFERNTLHEYNAALNCNKSHKMFHGILKIWAVKRSGISAWITSHHHNIFVRKRLLQLLTYYYNFFLL